MLDHCRQRGPRRALRQASRTITAQVLVLVSAACGSTHSSTPGNEAGGGNAGGAPASSGGAGGGGNHAMGGGLSGGASGAASAGRTSNGGATAQGGAVAKGGTSARGGTSSSNGGAAISGGAAAGGKANIPPATGTPGVWENVTSSKMDPALFSGVNGFGVGNIVTDPARPTDMYVGGYGSIWKSTDYGLTWNQLDSKPNPPYIPLGHVLAVAGTTPATLWMASASGEEHVYKSVDGGLTFELTGAIPEEPNAASLYSIVVDPYDATHLLSGLHEQDKVLESTDAGATWKFVSRSGWPAGGKSWFPFFLDTGDAATTRKTWLAIAQDGGSAVKTTDAGATWVKPKGIVNLQHPHGTAGLYQTGKMVFVAGVGADTTGDGVYRSTDLGDSFSQVSSGREGVVWGSAKNIYVMWGWACASCGLNEGGPEYQVAPYPGDDWSKPTLPSGLVWGPNSVATTSDGTRAIHVGSMWATGLWRYVEP